MVKLRKIYGLCALLCCLFACSQDDFIPVVPPTGGETETPEAGDEVTVRFDVSVSDIALVGEPVSAATRSTYDDSKVYSAYMFQFDGTAGSSTIVKRGEAVSVHGNGKLVYDLKLQASASANRVYLLANVTADDAALLPTLGTTLTEFESALLAFTDATIRDLSGTSASGLTKGGVPMIGYVDLVPGSQDEMTVSFGLIRMAAKISFTVTSTLDDFQLYSVRIRNVATSTSMVSVYPGTSPAEIASNFMDYEEIAVAQNYASDGSLALAQRTFAWYIPENLRGENTIIANDYYKCADLAPSDYCTYIEVLCSSSKGLATYRIFPGANSTTDFNVIRNTWYNVSLNIKGVSSYDLRTRELPDANCFILPPGGSETIIPVSRANKFAEENSSATRIEADDTVTYEVLWSDAAVIAEMRTIGTGNGGGTSLFVKSGSVEGNAVIAAKVGGEIKWSWHIWVTDDPTLNTWTNPNSTSYTFMDRNLGATEAANSLAGRGLFYQWGRKDPFPGGKSGVAGYVALNRFSGMPDAGSPATVKVSGSTVTDGILESVWNPLTYFINKDDIYKDWLLVNENTLWNTTDNRKTLYDPCPAGWRIPVRLDGTVSHASDDNSPWKGYYSLADNPVWGTWTTSDAGGVTFAFGVFYPAGGCRGGADGQLYASGGIGRYWSASVSYIYAYHLNLNNNGIIYPSGSNNSSSTGFNVRCVKE